MRGTTWIKITKQDRMLLLGALAELRRSDSRSARKIDKLIGKMVHSEPYPKIRVGIHGGQVEWILGNPFPIQVYDYDGTGDDDLPDVDERGQRCRIQCGPTANRGI